MSFTLAAVKARFLREGTACSGEVEFEPSQPLRDVSTGQIVSGVRTVALDSNGYLGAGTAGVQIEALDDTTTLPAVDPATGLPTVFWRVRLKIHGDQMREYVLYVYVADAGPGVQLATRLDGVAVRPLYPYVLLPVFAAHVAETSTAGAHGGPPALTALADYDNTTPPAVGDAPLWTGTDWAPGAAGGGGSGTVQEVAGVPPDLAGNVPLTAGDIGAAPTSHTHNFALREATDYDDTTAPTTGQAPLWDGSKYAPGDVAAGVFTSPNGRHWQLGVSNAGTTVWTDISPPAPSPTTPGEVAFTGDSLTYGTGAGPTFTYPAQLLARLGSNYVLSGNVAVSGRLLSNIDSAASSDFTPLHHTGYPNIAVVEGGTNDLHGGASATTVESYLTSACATIRGLGFKVVVVTITPRTDTTGPENTQRVAYNTWLRANWATIADALADWEADSRLSNAADTTYFGDGLHPTESGYNVAAQITRLAILSIYPDTSFAPSDLPNLVGWYEARNILGKVTGNGISQWPDLSTAAYHVAQATGSQQPTYQVANGRAVVRFDGVNDVLKLAGGSAANAFTLYVLGNMTSGVSTYRMSAGTQNAGVFSRLGTIAAWGAYLNTLLSSGSALGGTPAITTGVFHTAGSSVDLLTNGAGTNHLGQGFVPESGMSIGSNYGEAYWHAGDIEAVLLFAEVHDSTQQAAVHAYLAGIAGITL